MNKIAGRHPFIVVVLLVASAWLGALGTGSAVPAAETAVAPEKNPPGDIPDDQVFITYRGPHGFTMKVPEGWARTDGPSSVVFADKYGRIEMAVAEASAVPTRTTVISGEAAELARTGHAVKISVISDAKLPAGQAVKIAFTSNSEPNPVTNKRIRLENERFLIPGGGKVATVTFSAPAGADNADQWKLMSESFRWN